MRSAFRWQLAVLATAVLMTAVPATAAACAYPSAGDIRMPDGATAAKEEMIETQKQVKAYVAAVEAYLKCLQAEVDKTEADEETMVEVQRIHDSRHNAAVDAMDAVAQSFNAQVRAYNEAQAE